MPCIYQVLHLSLKSLHQVASPYSTQAIFRNQLKTVAVGSAHVPRPRSFGRGPLWLTCNPLCNYRASHSRTMTNAKRGSQETMTDPPFPPCVRGCASCMAP
eukprot:4737473-Prymnesium_polylepis.2